MLPFGAQLDLCGLLAGRLVSVLLQHFGELRYALYLAEAQNKGGTTCSLLPASAVNVASGQIYQIIQKKKPKQNKNYMMVIALRLCRKKLILLCLNTKGTKLKFKSPTILI